MKIKLKILINNILNLIIAFGVGLGVFSCILDLVVYYYPQIDCYRYFTILSGGFIFAFVFSLYGFIVNRKKYKSKIEIWIVNNTSKGYLLFILSYCFLSPFWRKQLFPFERLKEIVNLSWTITGISIMFFLVYEIILNYIKVRVPEYSDNFSLIEKVKYLEIKQLFYIASNSLFNAITCLTLNVVSLVLTSFFIYSYLNEIKYLQYLVLLTFNLSIFSFLQLFINISLALNRKKKKILNEQKFTQNDLDYENTILNEIERLLESCKDIDKKSDIPQEKRNELKKEILKQIQGEHSYYAIDSNGNIVCNYESSIY